MKKKLYETPRTQHVEVETEGNFCGSTIKDDGKSEVTTNKQEIEGTFTFDENDWN